MRRNIYGIARQKIRVVPFGANCDSPFSDESEAAAAVARRDWSVIRLVFVGVDWQRKGGDMAVTVDAPPQRDGDQDRADRGGMPAPARRPEPVIRGVRGFSVEGEPDATTTG